MVNLTISPAPTSPRPARLPGQQGPFLRPRLEQPGLWGDVATSRAAPLRPVTGGATFLASGLPFGGQLLQSRAGFLGEPPVRVLSDSLKKRHEDFQQGRDRERRTLTDAGKGVRGMAADQPVLVAQGVGQCPDGSLAARADIDQGAGRGGPGCGDIPAASGRPWRTSRRSASSASSASSNSLHRRFLRTGNPSPWWPAERTTQRKREEEPFSAANTSELDGHGFLGASGGCASHTFTVLSALPEAMRLPSGKNTTLVT
jgi:hypothetical protein